VASIDHESQGITLVSLSRDIWIEDLRTKLNSIYYWGEQKQSGGGLILAKSVAEEIVGVPIHYGLVVDFSGFNKIINVLGGVEVVVERSFIDEKFPIPGREADECDGDPEYLCRYETIEFRAGRQLMSGETALKFVRSRNSEDLDEGTDIARSARQQKILLAIKNKATSREILLSPSKVLDLKNVILDMIESDIDDETMAILARRGLQSQDNVQTSFVPEELLFRPPKSLKHDNLYVFVPADEDWSEVHKWFKGVF